MEDIKAGDALVCRDNFILLITDGETNGPGDVDAAGLTTCANLDCRVQWDDPNATVGPTFDAIKGSYSTTPASAVSGVQTEADEITPGGILFDARVDFPTWRGHLIAYDTQDIDAGTGQPNRDELFALGLGNTVDEAERIAQWMLGDPKQRNKAVLGAFVNSTPIELGPPGISSLPGGKQFHEQQKDRTSLVYAAADDGLLHAFFTRKTIVDGVTYEGGEEAFAYIPPDMLRVVTNLYTQGGQKADPREHIYGLTSDPAEFPKTRLRWGYLWSSLPK